MFERAHRRPPPDAHLLPRGPLGESWETIGPKQTLLWLRKCEGGFYLLTPALHLVDPGIATAIAGGLFAAECFGDWVHDLHVDDMTRVSIIAGRHWTG